MDEHGEEVLERLEKAVEEAFVRESDSSSHYERSSSSATLSVKDLDLKNGNSTSRHSTLLLEVLQEWRTLLQVMRKEAVFLEHLPNLSTAFRELSVIDKSLYRHMRTLVLLLANTVENSKRDNSTECRFVTLLEVMLSYCKKWQPSEEVSRLWVRLMQRIPADVPPVNFRRKAYRVLVSLSWVPSSKGLLEACSFEANRQSIDPQKSPAKVKSHLDKIRSRPQPRYDCVNQLLDRLKDETDVCVAVTADREGVGKTTLAALVASHPSILRVFRVLWLSINGSSERPSYDWYTSYLDDLCAQMEIELSWPVCVKRFEEPALRRFREEAAMQEARRIMTEAMRKRDENYLLILDDVVDAEKIEWFRFHERQSIIVTTPNSSLKGVDWTVELGPMSEEEAIELFLAEANFAVTHVLSLTVEVRQVVRLCGCHPLTVRTVGRWYKLKAVTAGIVKGMEELLKELSALIPEANYVVSAKVNGDAEKPVKDESPSAPLLFDVMSLMMGPARIDGSSTSIVFVMCLAAMAVVFPKKVPLDSILLLWEQLLKVEPHAIDELSQKSDPTVTEIRKQTWCIAEGLLHMGLVSVTDQDENPWVEVHHKLYKDFAMAMAKDMDFAETFEKTEEQWNKTFVTAYFSQRIEGTGDKADDNSWEYAIEKLPAHIFQARMFPMAETILSEEHFFRARVDAMGWDRAIDKQIEDCLRLQKALEDDMDESAGTGLAISPVFDHTATIIGLQAEGELGTSEAQFRIQVSRALFKLGFALAENGYYEQAVLQLDRAQSLLPQSQELRASILYGAGWALLASNNTEKALKKIKASRKVMEEYVSDHVLYQEAIQLQGEALVGECEYKEAAAFFEDAVQALKADPSRHTIELGAILNKKGRLHHMMGEMVKAKETFNECLNCKWEIGETSRDLSSVHSALGDISMEKRNVSEAREHYERALHVLESMKSDPNHVDFLLLTGKLRFLRNEFTGSLQSLELARKAIKEAPKLFMDQSAYDLRCIARSYEARGELETAVAILQESLALTNGRPYSLERSSGLHQLANCLIDQGEISEGLICLEQSLEIRILKLGECIQVLETLNSIGNVHMSLGAYEEALAVFDKVNELTNRISPNDIERIAGVLYSIGEVYDAKNDYTEAIAKFDECMAVLKRDRSADHPHIAKALQRLGDVTATQKDLDKAFEYYCEALRIRKMHYDERQLAETLHSIGVLTRKRKNLEAAREPLLDALEIRRKLDNGRETGQTLLEIGHIFRLQMDMENAISLYEKSLEVLEEKDDVRGSVCLALGHAMLSSGKDIEATKYYQRALDIRVAAYGRDNMKTGNVSRSLGLVKYLLNQPEAALIHLNEFIRVIEMNDEEDNEEEGEDIDYVLAILLMHDIHKANQRDEQAKNLLEVAKEVCDESDEVRDELPALVEMTERRLAAAEAEAGRRGAALLQRLNLSEEAGVHLTIDPEDVKILRQIAFIDD